MQKLPRKSSKNQDNERKRPTGSRRQRAHKTGTPDTQRHAAVRAVARTGTCLIIVPPALSVGDSAWSFRFEQFFPAKHTSPSDHRKFATTVRFRPCRASSGTTARRRRHVGRGRSHGRPGPRPKRSRRERRVADARADAGSGGGGGGGGSGPGRARDPPGSDRQVVLLPTANGLRALAVSLPRRN